VLEGTFTTLSIKMIGSSESYLTMGSCETRVRESVSCSCDGKVNIGFKLFLRKGCAELRTLSLMYCIGIPYYNSSCSSRFSCSFRRSFNGGFSHCLFDEDLVIISFCNGNFLLNKLDFIDGESYLLRHGVLFEVLMPREAGVISIFVSSKFS
jgi:hypothetical protein